MGKSLRVKVADEFSKEIIKTLEKDPRVGGAALGLFARLACIEGLWDVTNEKDWPKVMDLLEARMAKWADKLPEEKGDIIRKSVCEGLSDEDYERLERMYGGEA